MKSVFSFLWLCLALAVVRCEFRNIVVLGDVLVQEVYHVFNRSALAACVVIPSEGSIQGDVVFQPGNVPNLSRAGGLFRVETGPATDQFGDAFRILNGVCKLQCPMLPGGLLGCSGLAIANGCCLEEGEPQCNQLVFKPGVRMNRPSGEFVIQYVPQDMTALNVTVRFNSPGIYASRRSIQLMETDTSVELDFTLWPSGGVVGMSNITACEILEDGGRVPTDKLTTRLPREEANCYRPFSSLAAPRIVSTIPADVNLAALALGSTSQVFLSQTGCAGGVENDVVTIIAPPVPTTQVTTEEETTVESTTVVVPDQGTESRVFIIVGVVAFFVVLVVMVVLVLVCACAARKRMSGGAPVSPAGDRKVEEMELSSKPRMEENGKQEFVRSISANEYSALPLRSNVPETHQTSITKVAFVTASSSDQYRRLEGDIQTQHSCKRVQPCAVVDDQKPTLDDYWNGIVNLLKGGDCLVYIIWNGALEMMDDTHQPPMKKLIRSLAHRPVRINDSHGGTSSIMHRLVFLQLGSKGNANHLLSNTRSVTIFWEKSAVESSFDSKLCAESVCNKVKARLKSHDDQLKSGTAKEHGGAQNSGQVESVDGPGSHPKTAEKSDWREFGNMLGKRLGDTLTEGLHDFESKIREDREEKHGTVMKKLTEIGSTLNFVGEKVVESQVQNE